VLHVHTYRVSYAELTICRRMSARQFLVRNVPLTCVWSFGITTSCMFIKLQITDLDSALQWELKSEMN